MAELRATKRNPLLGLLADALSPVADYLSTSTNPLEDTGSDLSVTGLLGDTIRPVANTVNRMSYGEPLTTGRGMTTQMRPDTRDTLLAVSPMGAGTKAAGRGVKAGAQALSPQAERMLMDTMRKMGGIKDITAYHGSPHTFDKFSLDKIGTGEGAQVYGHGLYFADSPDVARSYQSSLTGFNPAHIESDLISRGISPEVANTYAQFAAQTGGKKNSFDSFKSVFDQKGPSPFIEEFRKKIRQEFPQLQKATEEQSGSFYKVDIPDEAVANMLLWDKPLSEQPKIMKALKMNIGAPLEAIKEGSGWAVKNTETGEILSRNWGSEDTARKFASLGGANAEANLTGQAYYKKLGEAGDASKKLKELGIPGIRYLDQGSRNAGSGTMNTVLFDDALVKILERNGVPMQGLLD